MRMCYSILSDTKDRQIFHQSLEIEPKLRLLKRAYGVSLAKCPKRKITKTFVGYFFAGYQSDEITEKFEASFCGV
jgi:hypothetical protein